jgi:hypothetical protein
MDICAGDGEATRLVTVQGIAQGIVPRSMGRIADRG